MNQSFSKMMLSSEGRYLTPVEHEQALCSALELPHRMRISQLIQASEFDIVDFATHAFCDTVPGFDGPTGSLRRKKGHQDGRIILRYIAQAIREGSTEILFEKVLSWLVGHLDSGNVTGHHMEVFFHFLQQGARRELPQHTHPFLDETFEEVIDIVRRATHSATIHKAHRRIAEFAVDRVMNILPDIKAKYGASSVPKCKRDLELLVKELARVMRSRSSGHMRKEFSRWLIERLVSQVEYSPNVWYWTFLAVREGIVECCGPEAAVSVSDTLELMADHVDQLLVSIKLCAVAGEIADSVAERLLQRGEALGLLRSDEFQTSVSIANRELITGLAVLHASGAPESQLSDLVDLWCNSILTQMPSNSTSLLASNLKLLLEVVSEKFDQPTTDAIRHWVQNLVDVARRTEAVFRLTEVVDRIAVESANWAIDNFSPFMADRRASYRDVRLVLGKILMSIPGGPAGVNGIHIRQYVTRLLLPNLNFNVGILQQVYERVGRIVESHAKPDDAKLVTAYLDDLNGCFERYSRLHRIPSSLDRIVTNAAERAYHAAPRHESLQRGGMSAGKRDGKFLLEKVVEAAIVGGHQAEQSLHQYFILEQVRLSKLPGKVVVEFLRGMLEHLREFPEVSELLFGLTQYAPLYAAAPKINLHSKDWAATASKNAVDRVPVYREQLGEKGLEACARDNAVMLRGLAHFITVSPGDIADFKQWWRKRIGQNIRLKPESFDASGPCAKTNFNEIVSILRDNLDSDESDAVVAYLNQIFEPRMHSSTSNSNANSGRSMMKMPVAMIPPLTTFSDVGV